MGTLVLIESVPEELDVRPGDTVVALTPDAYAGLRRRGLPFETLGDECEDRLAEAAAARWNEQLVWLDSFDAALAERLPEVAGRDLRPALLFVYFLKGRFDTVFIRGVELSALLERDSFERVVLYRTACEESPLDHTLPFLGGPSVVSQLLPLFARARGFEYEERLVPAPPEEARVAAPSRSSHPRVVTRRIADAGVQVVEVLLGTGRRVLWRRRRLTFLFASQFYDLEALLHAARRHGHRCLFWMRDDRTMDVSRLRSRELGKLAPPNRDERFQAVAAAVTASDQPLWEWPNSWFNVPVSEILEPRLRFWVAEVLPHLYDLSDQALELLERERVDFLVVPHLWFLGDFALVDAARRRPGTEAVQIEHGDGAQALPVWDLLNFIHFDRHFAPSEEFAAYLLARAERFPRPTAAVHVGSYRRKELSKRAGRRGPAPELVEAGRPVVVYGLGAAGGDDRYLDSDWSPDVWFFELETRIIELMSRDERYLFIVKTFPGVNHVHELIANFVAELGSPNLQVSARPFVDWLPVVDRVVLDAASTATAEAALARVPFLALINERIALRPGAAEIFGPSIASFRTIDEAVERVRVFLNEPAPYTPSIELDGKDILTTLEELRA